MKDIYAIDASGYSLMYCDNLELIKNWLRALGNSEEDIENCLRGGFVSNEFDEYIEISKIHLANEFLQEVINEELQKE